MVSKQTRNVHAQMRVLMAIGKPCGGASIGVTTNSSELTRSGRDITIFLYRDEKIEKRITREEENIKGKYSDLRQKC
jgi:hypothetical protein